MLSTVVQLFYNGAVWLKALIHETRNNRLVLASGSSSAGSAGQRDGRASPCSASWCDAGKDGDPGRDTLLSEGTELCAAETFLSLMEIMSPNLEQIVFPKGSSWSCEQN